MEVVKLRICKICGAQFEPIKFAHTRKYCYECVPYEHENISHADCVTAKRRAIKRHLVEMAGGKCAYCGYNKCFRALEFHHINPEEKDFGLSRCLTKDISKLEKEIEKCILLCSNCHSELHQKLYEQGYRQFNPDI